MYYIERECCVKTAFFFLCVGMEIIYKKCEKCKYVMLFVMAI